MTWAISLLSSGLLRTAAPSPMPGGLPADRLDHRGAVGLGVALGFEAQGTSTDPGPDGSHLNYAIHDEGMVLRLLPALAVGDNGNELQLDLRLFQSLAHTGFSGGVGYRGYFGRDEAKTFFEFGVRADTRPAWALSGTVGIGFMYELDQLWGLMASGEIAVGYGSHLRYAAAVFAGVQLRSYVLDP